MDIVEDKDEGLKFVDNAFQIAFQISCTYAYNDSEVPKSLVTPPTSASTKPIPLYQLN